MGNVKDFHLGRFQIRIIANTRPWQKASWFTPAYFDGMASLFTAVGPIIFEITVWRNPK